MMRYFLEMFRRWPPRNIPPPPRLSDQRGWNADWEVGDLARCVVDTFKSPDETPPSKGQLLRVTGLREGPGRFGDCIISGLDFEGFSETYHCTGFVKIRPDEEAADEEFTIALLTGKPAQVRA